MHMICKAILHLIAKHYPNSCMQFRAWARQIWLIFGTQCSFYLCAFCVFDVLLYCLNFLMCMPCCLLA